MLVDHMPKGVVENGVPCNLIFGDERLLGAGKQRPAWSTVKDCSAFCLSR